MQQGATMQHFGGIDLKPEFCPYVSGFIVDVMGRRDWGLDSFMVSQII
jgi:hypothetical protein